MPSSREQCAATARVFFEKRFGVRPDHITVAPGRINLIGEHLDYNGGPVVPMTIDRHVAVAGRVIPRDPATPAVATISSGFHGLPITIEIGSGLEPQEEEAWANYPIGVIAGLLKAGADLPSCEIFIASDLPVGAGLSSSAALCVALSMWLEKASNHRLESIDRARLCQAAEHQFAMVPCGIMDQLASIHGKAGHALRIDCRTLEIDPIPMSEETSLIVLNTAVQHCNAEGEYGTRRRTCEELAKAMGVGKLAEAGAEKFYEMRSEFPPHAQKRARHVFSEIDRTNDFVEALAQSDWSDAGELMFDSHRSLRDLYEVSCPELDAVVDIAEELGKSAGVYGARMTGGGFGGSAIVLVDSAKAAGLLGEFTARYEKRTGSRPAPVVVQPVDGAGEV